MRSSYLGETTLHFTYRQGEIEDYSIKLEILPGTHETEKQGENKLPACLLAARVIPKPIANIQLSLN